jgi:hypothetical protein
MSRLLFAAARGARIEGSYKGFETWSSVSAVRLDNFYDYRIHPDDAHLQYGPISTALRNEALAETWGVRWHCADAFIAEYMTGSPWLVHSFSDTRMFLLILAEFLADEGM